VRRARITHCRQGTGVYSLGETSRLTGFSEDTLRRTRFQSLLGLVPVRPPVMIACDRRSEIGQAKRWSRTAPGLGFTRKSVDDYLSEFGSTTNPREQLQRLRAARATAPRAVENQQPEAPAAGRPQPNDGPAEPAAVEAQGPYAPQCLRIGTVSSAAFGELEWKLLRCLWPEGAERPSEGLPAEEVAGLVYGRRHFLRGLDRLPGLMRDLNRKLLDRALPVQVESVGRGRQRIVRLILTSSPAAG
jgi:hypothetical protein